MKLRFRPALPARPSRADGTLLPAMLAGVLLLVLLTQFVLTDTVPLPEGGPIGAGALMPRLSDPSPRGVPAAVLGRPIFAPTDDVVSEDGDEAGESNVLGGAAIVGSIGVGRARVAVVTEGGRIRRVGVGGSIAGWRLAAITQEGVVLTRGGERLERPFTAGDLPDAPEAPEAPAAASDESDLENPQ
ncbi:hypothetical protein [Sphingomonas sp.]|uniref:hypothetical protein n=1 Tax=Sphingomonas sp. TaxID=28214 RepID=UPI0035C86737